MTIEKTYLCMADREQLSAFVKQNGIPSYRADQLENWVSKRFTVDTAAMGNIPKDMRALVNENFMTNTIKLEQAVIGEDGSGKLLLSLHDGETIECAIIASADKRITFCISTQVGCPVRCAFCSSGSTGFVRNLTSGEIVEQFFTACRHIGGRLPDNLVVMGIGEPLLNCDNLIAALDRICDPERTEFAARRVTVSTSGWTPGIKQLAEHGRQWNLALSLHAPDDKVRSILIPTRFRRDIQEIMRACEFYRERTSRMLTFEYVLLENINDSTEQASRLAKLAKEHHAKVNLIPYNKAFGAFSRPSPFVIKRFENTLKAAGVQVTTRVEKGFASSAACGQLRASAKKEHVK